MFASGVTVGLAKWIIDDSFILFSLILADDALSKRELKRWYKDFCEVPKDILSEYTEEAYKSITDVSIDMFYIVV